MKTSQNIALRSAQFIRAAIQVFGTDATLMNDDERSALATLEEVATQLEQHAAGFEPSADTERLDWLEAHDFSATCYNVPDRRDANRWAAPMKPNNGWVIGLATTDEDDDDQDDPHGVTLRDAIDWARKIHARRTSTGASR